MAYAHVTKPASVEPGLSDFLIGIKSEFTTIQKPVAPFTNPGDSQTIVSAHVPVATKGFYRCYIDKKKHTGKGDQAGTFGSKTLANEYDVFLPGFDAVRLELVKNLMNEEVITLHRDANCDLDTFIQLGNECRPAEIDGSYTLGTFEPTGEKGIFLKVKWTGIPYIYDATVPYAS